YVVSLVGIIFLDQIKPWRDIASYRLNGWWFVQIEDGATGPMDPAAVGNELVRDQHRLARRPRHLFDGPIDVEPSGRRNGLALKIKGGRRHPRVDARRRPQFTCRHENVGMLRHVGDEVVERDAGSKIIRLVPLRRRGTSTPGLIDLLVKGI